MSGSLEYRSSDLPSAAAIAVLYDAARLRRPTGDLDRIARMVQGSNVTLACFESLDDGDERHAGGEARLVGFLRGWTDYAFDGYVCDLAVHPDLQHRGIGKELLRRATSIGAPEVQWVLLASAIAKDYYAHLGWEKLENAWKWPREGFAPPADHS
ncbi:MAG: GNAT family N-acetyltransferase [Holophagaceae bacterium]|nr:GNAT family N-acetyltransferase [Holophagaceae bacterium]